jgi:hypothetical protein
VPTYSTYLPLVGAIELAVGICISTQLCISRGKGIKEAKTGQLGESGSIQLSRSILPRAGGQMRCSNLGNTYVPRHQDPCSRCTTLSIENLVSTAMGPYSVVSPQCSHKVLCALLFSISSRLRGHGAEEALRRLQGLKLHQAKSPSRSTFFVPRIKLHRLLASNLSIKLLSIYSIKPLTIHPTPSIPLSQSSIHAPLWPLAWPHVQVPLFS